MPRMRAAGAEAVARLARLGAFDLEPLDRAERDPHGVARCVLRATFDLPALDRRHPKTKLAVRARSDTHAVAGGHVAGDVLGRRHDAAERSAAGGRERCRGEDEAQHRPHRVPLSPARLVNDAQRSSSNLMIVCTPVLATAVPSITFGA